MTNTLNQDQTFPITEQPEADSVTITVMDVYNTTNNGFKEIYFDGEEGKTILYNHLKGNERNIVKSVSLSFSTT